MGTESPSNGVQGRGTVRLAPLPGSVDRSTFEIDIDLHHHADALSIGDLRRCAEQLSESGRHEHAFRMWSMVERAARRLDQTVLAAAAAANAGHAKRQAEDEGRPDEQSSRTVPDRRQTDGSERVTNRYDYDAIFDDVESGLSRTQAARKWGCSPSTVVRAVDYVTARNDVLDESPEILDQLMAGLDLLEVARRYDVEPKILRWMVATRFNRRER